jgi:hypothetical protein
LDDVGVKEGGTLQHVSDSGKYIYFYSEKASATSVEDASGQVIISDDMLPL